VKSVWNWLGALSSLEVARRVLAKHPADPPISEDASADRARSLAFAVRSAREYFHGNPEGNLTESCLAYYYGLLNLLEALVIVAPSEPHSIAQIENFTRRGHGVHNLSSTDAPFPESEIVYFLNRGFALQYGRVRRLELEPLVQKQVDEHHQLERPAFTLKDLLLRVPEIRPATREIWPTSARCVFLSQWGDHNDGSVELIFAENQNDSDFSPDAVIRSVPELKAEWFSEEAYNQAYRSRLLRVKVPATEKNQIPKPLRSALCLDAYVEPFIGTTRDMLLVHFLILYLLSIFVRYRPNLWRRVVEGDLDQFRPVVAEYLQCVERMVPNIVLNELHRTEFFFQQLARFG
jgi:hypothetical protein